MRRGLCRTKRQGRRGLGLKVGSGFASYITLLKYAPVRFPWTFHRGVVGVGGILSHELVHLLECQAAHTRV